MNARTMMALAALSLSACSGDKEHDEGPICSEVAEACHEAAEQSGDPDAEACHDLAHEGDEDACDAQHDDCIALCDDLMATMTTTGS
ncbi:MAG: hypothetical protein R3F59_20450 [Myxococcota bacterium]